jgi:hypothetical protein
MKHITDKIRDDINMWMGLNDPTIKILPDPMDFVIQYIELYLQTQKINNKIDDYNVSPLHNKNCIDCVVVFDNTHHYFPINLPKSEEEKNLHPDIYKAYDRAMRGI